MKEQNFGELMKNLKKTEKEIVLFAQDYHGKKQGAIFERRLKVLKDKHADYHRRISNLGRHNIVTYKVLADGKTFHIKTLDIYVRNEEQLFGYLSFKYPNIDFTGIKKSVNRNPLMELYI